MKAKEYLQQVSKLDKLINNKLIEIEQWKAIATGTTAHSDGERVQASGSQQKMADAVCKYVAIEEEINKYIDELIEARQEVIRTIEQLPAIEYDLLHKVYIQGEGLGDITEIYDKTYSWVTTTHGNALKHVQNIINRKVQPCVKKDIET